MAATMMSTFARAGIQVKAVVSRDQERANRFARDFDLPAAETDLESVLQRSDIKAVYIANSPQDHASTCVAALEAGKAVLCEKPIATSEAEVHHIILAARKTQTLCMEGIWTLFLPAYRRFLEHSRNGICGQPDTLTADFGYPVDQEIKQR